MAPPRNGNGMSVLIRQMSSDITAMRGDVQQLLVGYATTKQTVDRISPIVDSLHTKSNESTGARAIGKLATGIATGSLGGLIGAIATLWHK